MRTNVTVLGSLEIAAAKGTKYSTKRERIVARAVSREMPRKGTDMAKSFDLRYAQSLVEFKTRLALDIQKSAKANAKAIVNIEQGRKFDKVMIGTITDEKVSRLETRYFVDQKDGSVYGAKSPLAPNLNHFYGTIHDSAKWDWSGDRAKPYDEADAGVVAVGGYGDYKHYVRKSAAKAVATA